MEVALEQQHVIKMVIILSLQLGNQLIKMAIASLFKDSKVMPPTSSLLPMVLKISVLMPSAPIWAALFHGTRTPTSSSVLATALNMTKMVRSSEDQLHSVSLSPTSISRELTRFNLDPGLKKISEQVPPLGGNDDYESKYFPIINFENRIYDNFKT